jgi:predicted outer membrane repeat protein
MFTFIFFILQCTDHSNINTGMKCGDIPQGSLVVPDDYETIDSAVNAAEDGDVIIIRPGIYNEHIVIDSKTITLASCFSITGDTAFISNTIIDGGGTLPCVRFINETNESSLIGLTLLNGGNKYNLPHGGGGVQVLSGANPLISHVRIIENQSTFGGGMYTSRSSIQVYDTEIKNNIVKGEDSGGLAAFGGGICSYFSDIYLENVKINSNKIIGGEDWESAYGGGIYIYNSTLNLLNVEISENQTEFGSSLGGGLYTTKSWITLEGTSIHNNEAIHGKGGGIYSNDDRSYVFDPVNRSSIYSNTAGIGQDLYHQRGQTIEVIVDTFTTQQPTDFYAEPVEMFTFENPLVAVS